MKKHICKCPTDPADQAPSWSKNVFTKPKKIHKPDCVLNSEKSTKPSTSKISLTDAISGDKIGYKISVTNPFTDEIKADIAKELKKHYTYPTTGYVSYSDLWAAGDSAAKTWSGTKWAPSTREDIAALAEENKKLKERVERLERIVLGVVEAEKHDGKDTEEGTHRAALVSDQQ